jgi:hypothetical protein
LIDSVVILVEQRSLAALVDELKKSLFDDVLVQRHCTGFAGLDRACVGPEPHDMEVTALLDVNATQLSDFTGSSARVSAQPR